MDGDTTALTAEQQHGFSLFGNNTVDLGSNTNQGPARCSNCHGGPETTDASIFKVSQAINISSFRTGVGQLRRRQGNVIDLGFNNIGVTPTLEDLGVGGTDLNGNALSVARQAFLDGPNSTIRIQDPAFPNDPTKTIPFVNSTSTPDIFGSDGAF